MEQLLNSPNLRGGMLYMQVNGRRYDAKGEFTYKLGTPKMTAIVGADGVHGASTEAQAPYIEGALTDERGLDLKAFFRAVDATMTLELQNGKVVMLSEAWYAGEGTVKTKEGEVAVKFEGMMCEEIK